MEGVWQCDSFNWGHALKPRASYTVIVSALLLGPSIEAARATVHPGRPATTDIEAVLSSLPKPPAVKELTGLGPRPKGRSHYLAILASEAARRGLPVAVADAVATIESGYDPSAIGKVGEFGLMQVRPQTAAMLGFKGNKEALADPVTNVRYGVEYLAGAWRLAEGDLCRTLMKYRAGHGEERMSPLSVEYCRRARVHLASIGSPLAAPESRVAAPSELSKALAVPPVREAAAPSSPEPQRSAEEQARAAQRRKLTESFVRALAGVGSAHSPSNPPLREAVQRQARTVPVGRERAATR